MSERFKHAAQAVTQSWKGNRLRKPYVVVLETDHMTGCYGYYRTIELRSAAEVDEYIQYIEKLKREVFGA